MNVPRVLREQVKAYEKAGFHVTDVEPRNGSHFRLRFAEFDEPQIVTKNITDPRALKNNISHYKRVLQGALNDH